MRFLKHHVKRLTVIDGTYQVFSSQIATSAGQMLTLRVIFMLFWNFLVTVNIHERDVSQALI